MLSIITYESNQNLRTLDFVKENNDLETVVVCPNPLVADAFREKLDISDPLKSAEVFTISKFVSDLIKRHVGEMNLTRKSDLMIILGGVWKAKFSHLPDDVFQQAFNVFTDLRSYTLDINLISEVLENLDSDIAEVVGLFWQIIESPVMEILDEHGAYQVLAEKVRESGASFDSTNIIFYGFSHLSGSQIDLIKSLSINHEVYIPISKKVLSHLVDFDWPKWLDNDLKFEKKDAGPIEPIKRKFYGFLKNRLGESLLAWKEQGHDHFDVFIAEKNPNYNQVSEIPFEGFFFKTSVDIMGALFRDIFIKLKSAISDEMPAESLLSHLQSLFDDELGKDDSDKNFRRLKALQLVMTEIRKMRELTDSFNTFGIFEISLLEEVVSLNAPRTSSIPLLRDEKKGEIKGLSALETYNPSRENVFIISGDYLSLKGKEDFYSEEIMNILSSIGPVKRPEFEFQSLRVVLDDIIKSEKTSLFIERDLLEHDLNWATIFHNYEMIEEDLERATEVPGIKDVPDFMIEKGQHEIGNMSATRIQTYLDCPRKFYFNYLDKLDQRVGSNEMILPMDLGSLEHKVIENYMNDHESWCEKEHVLVVEKTLNGFIDEKKLKLSQINFQSYFVEIRDYSRNGIKVLLDFKLLDPIVRYSFEKNLTAGENGIVGSIDCIIEGRFGKIILDFKRSGGSIPSMKEIQELKKIQLWFYFLYSEIPENEVSMLGYVDLSDPKSSRLIAVHDEMISVVKKLENLKGVKVDVPKFDTLEKLDDFKTFHLEKWNEMKLETAFEAKPAKSDVCTFCPIKRICPRNSAVVSGEVVA